MKKGKKHSWLWVLCIVNVCLLCMIVFLVCARIRVTSSGKRIGEIQGKLVGTALGSWKGITEGVPAGIADGEKDGLSAQDTVVSEEICEAVTDIGKLDVLVAGVKIRDLAKIGEAYKALYLIKGDVVFSVDLTKASVSFSPGGDKVTVHIPRPEMKLTIDESRNEKLAEAQKFSFTVNAKNGIEEYFNSRNMSKEKIEETMMGYDSLMKTAEEAAINQVTRLVYTVCGESKEVRVVFE